jgi:hypothetical protein
LKTKSGLFFLILFVISCSKNEDVIKELPVTCKYLKKYALPGESHKNISQFDTFSATLILNYTKNKIEFKTNSAHDEYRMQVDSFFERTITIDAIKHEAIRFGKFSDSSIELTRYRKIFPDGVIVLIDSIKCIAY